MRESEVEGYLKEQCELHGALCEKHVSPGLRGVPDRLITWTDGVMYLVETKAPSVSARGNQTRDHERRMRRRCYVALLDTKAGVDAWIAQRVNK